MPEAWKQWVGQAVNGDFSLNQYLGGSEHSAVFQTERHEGNRLAAAAIKLIPATPGNSELQLSRWRSAAGLSHPHLIRLFEFGKCELGSEPLLYVVMEQADENLAQVLSDRALTPAEARAMLEPVLEVLAFLHSRGFVHGDLKPSNILANGEQLKVSSDALCRAGDPVDARGAASAYDPPESGPGFIPMARTMSPAGDVWSLGMTLVEVLTRRLPTQLDTGQGGPLLPKDLPEPFLDIARHCLLQNPESRCTVAQIVARLRANSSPIPQARKPASAGKPAARPVATPPKKRPKYIVPIAIGVVLVASLAVSGLLRRGSESRQQAPAPSAIQEPIAQPAAQPPAAPQPPPANVSGANAPEAGQNSVSAAPAPAQPLSRVNPDADGAKRSVKPTGGVPAGGEVVQQILPEVPQSARDTIHGTIKIAVRVDVDPSGGVKGAELETPDASKYFSRLALQAAQRWKFKPQIESSTWTLRFQFNRAETTVAPEQGTLR